ncbi:unnamed protein product, partial [Urochloa humidicola]
PSHSPFPTHIKQKYRAKPSKPLPISPPPTLSSHLLRSAHLHQPAIEMEQEAATGLVIRKLAPGAAARLWKAANASLHLTLLFLGLQIMYLVAFFNSGGVLAAVASGDLTKMALVVAEATVSGAAMWMGVVIWIDGNNRQRYGAAAWVVLVAAFGTLVSLVIDDGRDLEKFLDIMFKQLDVLIKLFGGQR